MSCCLLIHVPESRFEVLTASAVFSVDAVSCDAYHVTTRRHNLEDRNMNLYRCEKFESCIKHAYKLAAGFKST